MEYNFYQWLQSIGCLSDEKSVVFFSSYLPQECNPAFAGLINAASYRFIHPGIPVIICSFLSHDRLVPYDMFGVLSLPGTHCVTLPLAKAELFARLNGVNLEPTVPVSELRNFTEKVACHFVVEKFNKQRHTGEIPLGNMILVPLRAASIGAMSSESYPGASEEYLHTIGTLLRRAAEYLNQPDVALMIRYAEHAPISGNTMLASVKKYVVLLKQLSAFDLNRGVQSLIDLIDQVRGCFKEISQYIDRYGTTSYHNPINR